MLYKYFIHTKKSLSTTLSSREDIPYLSFANARSTTELCDLAERNSTSSQTIQALTECHNEPLILQVVS